MRATGQLPGVTAAPRQRWERERQGYRMNGQGMGTGAGGLSPCAKCAPLGSFELVADLGSPDELVSAGPHGIHLSPDSLVIIHRPF
ncbi:MAG: hypothetical protein M0Z53_09820 [Thermaerobacter sp.]|nr:hypothetical protein [Thermaerobacter sp.]